MSELQAEIIEVVASTINEGREGAAIVLDRNSGLNDPAEWDSLIFVKVFLAITDYFDLDVDDDDAIEFVSIESIERFVRQQNPA